LAGFKVDFLCGAPPQSSTSLLWTTSVVYDNATSPITSLSSPLPILSCDVNVKLMYLLCSTLGLKCDCNQNHSACVNNSCTTDTECQRILQYTNCAITADRQLCVPLTELRNPCNFVDRFFVNDSFVVILAAFCCRTERCNSNNTLIKEFIEGMFIVYIYMYRVCHIFSMYLINVHFYY